MVEIYTDGACSGNPGKGGWGAVIIYNKEEFLLQGKENYTTNQRMELTGAIEGLLEAQALKMIESFEKIRIYTDSAYLCNSWKQSWWKAWVRNGWQNSKKQPVANKELWEQLVPFFQMENFEIVKIKGHSGNHYNEVADKLATGKIIVN